MANRNWVLPSFQLEKQVVRLYAHVTFGASGAATLDAKNSKGVVSITKNSTGVYTLVLGTNAASLDYYYRLLSVKVTWDATGNSGTAPAAPLVYLTGNSVATASTCSLQLTCTNVSQSATNPASGEGCLIEIILSNSGAA